jgi:phosphatidylethanolamine/phosphatidyl-N-methylethanolamine N-methyltransferase
MGTLTYIRNFMKDRQVASITPTSRYTIERICQHINFGKDLRIVEFGPASGVFTKVLLERLSPGSGIIALETNRNFADTLSELGDERLTVINRSAEKVREVATAKKWDRVDYILSGIPFSFLKKEVKRKILKDSAALLTDKGYFLGYQTSYHLKPYLSEHFSRVDTELEYLNIPPMCIYIAGK